MQKTVGLACLIALATALPAQGGPAGPASSDTLDLSLEDLMQVVVTSVSKKSQTLAETAAAAYVITADDIRRSGATNIPEALRMAPGVQVAAIGNNKWAVSIRGFGDRFANKLLVLVDGRSVYTPLFSGVLWETLDVPLENVARIEVIRGPGASIWGANAVNGVINIITKSAFDLQGGELVAAGGTEVQASGLLRYGWNPNPDTALSVHLMAQNVGASQRLDGDDGVDDWLNQSAGFRLQHLLDSGTITVEGAASRSLAGDLTLINTVPPASVFVNATQRVTDEHLIARWESRPGEGHQESLQAYVTHSDFDHVILSERRLTADLEFQQRVAFGTRHDLIWGLGYRHSGDRIDESPVLSPNRPTEQSSLCSFYAQDEITLQPDHWRLSLGARFDYDDFTHLGVQPNVRLLWTPDGRDSLWMSVARALRTPSRLEHGAVINLNSEPDPGQAFLPPTMIRASGGPIDDERLDAVDFGWRRQLHSNLSLDLAGFHYRYESIRGSAMVQPVFVPPGYLLIPAVANNGNSAREHGLEASLDWRVLPSWRLQAGYSWLQASLDISSRPGQLPSEYQHVSPTSQFSLRSSLDLPHALRWDLWLRAVSRVDRYAVPGCASLDMRIAWQATEHLEVAVVGQNLLDDAHPEYGTQFIQSMPAAIERGGYARVDWKF